MFERRRNLCSFEGASRTDEELVSNLWSGLLANAMDPNSVVSFEIHYTKVLEQLHSQDVKILDFIKFHSKRVAEMRKDLPSNFHYGSYSHGQEDEYKVKKNNYDKIENQANLDIKEKYDSLRFDQDLIRNSIENLIRLDLIFLDDEGVDISNSFIEGYSWDSRGGQIDTKELENTVSSIINHLEYMSERRLREQEANLFSGRSSQNMINLEYCFTAFGKRLIKACYVD